MSFVLQILCETVEDAERVLAATKAAVEPVTCQLVDPEPKGEDLAA